MLYKVFIVVLFFKIIFNAMLIMRFHQIIEVIINFSDRKIAVYKCFPIFTAFSFPMDSIFSLAQFLSK